MMTCPLPPTRTSLAIIDLLSALALLATWAISKKGEFQSTPYQLKFCVFASLLYGVMETLPSLFLKFDLPCGCETEEWCVSVPFFATICYGLLAFDPSPFMFYSSTGDGTMCWINRGSVYILVRFV
jgi:hypothetical protein